MHARVSECDVRRQQERGAVTPTSAAPSAELYQWAVFTEHKPWARDNKTTHTGKTAPLNESFQFSAQSVNGRTG